MNINIFLFLELGYYPLFWKMSKYKYIHRDHKIIRKLLIEIGQYEYESNLARLKLLEQKPISLKDFYLELNEFELIYLCYTYGSGYTVSIMKVNGYDNVPMDGWSLKRQS